MTTLLIDGDILVYSTGFASEERWYEAKCPSSGEVKIFKGKKDIKLYNKDIADDEIELCRSAEPAHLAQMYLRTTIQAWERKFKTDDIRIYLTDSDLSNNFRYKMNPEYKANRKGGVKPLHYQMLRDYVTANYDTTIVSGLEADDALGIAQTDSTIIISKDKDLLQVPGRHYNITKNKQIKASNKGRLELWRDKAGKARLTGTGFKWFCAQMLLGDDVDNIKGIARMGAVRVHKAFEEAKTKQECWDIVKKIYEKREREDLILNAHMLWILREEEDYFDETKI